MLPTTSYSEYSYLPSFPNFFFIDFIQINVIKIDVERRRRFHNLTAYLLLHLLNPTFVEIFVLCTIVTFLVRIVSFLFRRQIYRLFIESDIFIQIDVESQRMCLFFHLFKVLKFYSCTSRRGCSNHGNGWHRFLPSIFLANPHHNPLTQQVRIGRAIL